jgi:GT2 family glycosyltransferase
MIKNTFIFNPIRPDYIHRCLETLYQYTDMTANRVIVVDQTMDGLKLPMDKVHLVLRPNRNLGFSKSMNEGIIHALRWDSEYITCANDDIEYIDKRWWSGIEETFEKYGDKVLAVNPMSPREPGWGYGLPHGENIDLLPYKTSYTSEEYDYLLKGDFSQIQGAPETYPKQKNGVIDAIATWHTTFKAEAFSKIGLFDERYYPGGGEDYDLNARAYREGYRMLGTTLSWVWHHWGSSKDHQSEFKDTGMPIVPELRWMNPDKIWPPEANGGQRMDPWGKWTDHEGNKHPMYREEEIAIIEI